MRAILIEDSEAIRSAIVPALYELCGVVVTATAEEAVTGIELLENEECDLVLLDLFLRKGSGLDVLASIQSTQFSAPVIVLTNYATSDARRRCLSAGATAVFDKSTELDAFFEHCLEMADRQLLGQPAV